jgi:hypothetical protein
MVWPLVEPTIHASAPGVPRVTSRCERKPFAKF